MPSPRARSYRLFFALWPSAELRDTLATWSRQHAPQGARPVRPDNLHLTLAFLGSLPEERLDAVHAAGAALRAAPVRLELARVEHWPRPRLLCALPAPGPDPLAGLATALREQLTTHRLPVETRPFRSHVTLVRKVSGTWSGATFDPPLTWVGKRFALVVSESTREGVRYRELAGWPLRDVG
jgi:2'-5' RNA ligase